MKNNFNLRIGYGYDVHQLKLGEDLILGGIHILHNKGSVGHSDADVLTHSICDAILGAANMRDIGFHFPDNSPEYKGVDSKILLRNIMALVRKKKLWDCQYRFNNLLRKSQSQFLCSRNAKSSCKLYENKC